MGTNRWVEGWSASRGAAPRSPCSTVLSDTGRCERATRGLAAWHCQPQRQPGPTCTCDLICSSVIPGTPMTDRMRLGVAVKAPPSCSTAATNRACSCGVHRSRPFLPAGRRLGGAEQSGAGLKDSNGGRARISAQWPGARSPGATPCPHAGKASPAWLCGSHQRHQRLLVPSAAAPAAAQAALNVRWPAAASPAQRASQHDRCRRQQPRAQNQQPPATAAAAAAAAAAASAAARI